jgi:hypothetical protein
MSRADVIETDLDERREAPGWTPDTDDFYKEEPF